MSDLGRPAWQRVLELMIAGALGIVLVVGWSAISAPEPAAALPLSNLGPPAQTAPAPSAPAAAGKLDIQMVLWRDEAEALTTAGVALDEQTRERWLGRLETLRDRLEVSNADSRVRSDVHATLEALERVGVLRN